MLATAEAVLPFANEGKLSEHGAAHYLWEATVVPGAAGMRAAA